MKNILLVAFHFPPVKGSSGLHRALSMAKYLPEYGWYPAVLTASTRAYENTSDELLPEIPQTLDVKRAFAFDTTRHLSFKGRYFQWCSLPDRWVSWWFGAVSSGLSQIRKMKPDLLWSTYPIATAHLIGLTLHKLTGTPWVVDFRDSMTEENYPSHPWVRSAYRWIERKAVKNAVRIVFTTSGTADMYAQRYPEIPREKWSVIENAVDEDFFCQIERSLTPKKLEKGHKLKLLHSGILYPSERDPTHFFNAIQLLKTNGDISPDMIEFVLRASTNEVNYRQWVTQLGIDDLVSFEPSIPYAKAIEEMLLADGLLIFQSRSCNHQIPAKIYEYFRSGRPILGLTDPRGNTAELLATESGTFVAQLDMETEILGQLQSFIEYCHQNRNQKVRSTVEKHSRKVRVEQYKEILDKAIY